MFVQTDTVRDWRMELGKSLIKKNIDIAQDLESNTRKIKRIKYIDLKL